MREMSFRYLPNFDQRKPITYKVGTFSFCWLTIKMKPLSLPLTCAGAFHCARYRVSNSAVRVLSKVIGVIGAQRIYRSE